MNADMITCTGRVYDAHCTGRVYDAHAHLATHGRDKSGPYGGRRKRGPYRNTSLTAFTVSASMASSKASEMKQDSNWDGGR
jgi:hypothetical protein